MSVPPVQFASGSFAIAAEANSAPAPWRPGDVVSGEFIGVDGAITILAIDGVDVAADVPAALAIPPRFDAIVVSGGPRPVLEIVGARDAPSPYAGVLRARLAEQDGAQPVLADLRALAASPAIDGAPEPLRMALARLEASVAIRDDLLDPELLRDALGRSGIQLEHQLAALAGSATTTVRASVEYDFKAALERLIAVLPDPAGPAAAGGSVRATPPALADLPLQAQPRAVAAAVPAADLAPLLADMALHARAAHARIELLQADAAGTNAALACMGEIPVQGRGGFDVLQVRMRAADARPDRIRARPREWVVEFTFAPPELGAVQGQITLREVCVSVDLWAERERTVAALEDQVDALLQLLRVSGLAAPEVQVHHGVPARHTAFGRRFLDATV